MTMYKCMGDTLLTENCNLKRASLILFRIIFAIKVAVKHLKQDVNVLKVRTGHVLEMNARSVKHFVKVLVARTV